MTRKLAALTLSAACALAAAGAPGLAGATAANPTLKTTTLDGKPFDLAAQKGKWVIVNFWATWCAPCLKELPDLSAYVQSHKDKVVGIGLAFEDSDKADIEKFLKTHPLSYPVAQVDVSEPPKDFDEPKGLPNTYLIAPDGHVAKAFLGPITSKEIDAVVNAK